jgi:hypothetical protein
LKAWTNLIASRSEVIYKREWNRIQDVYRNHPQLLAYVKTTWLEPHRYKLIHCWVDEVTHFGHRTTSRVEGAHKTLKGYLQVSTGDLKMVVDNIERLLIHQHTELEATLGEAKIRPGHDLQIPLLADVIGRVTPYALRKILQQFRILRSTTFRSSCSKLFLSAMGLPCAHKLKELETSGEALQLQHIHPQWYFTRPVRPFTMEPLLRNPPIAVTRGRPRGTASCRQRPENLTRRNPSQFELEQQQNQPHSR